MSNPKDTETENIAIRYADRGLDDIFIKNVTMFRMEWMDDNSVWVCCYTEDNPDGHRFHLHARGKITGTYEGDE